MALAAGRGVAREPGPAGIPALGWWFGEDQARYLVATDRPDQVLAAAMAAGVPAGRVGTVDRAGDGAALTLAGADAISLDELRRAHEDWLPNFMAAPGFKS
jgi:phosphoribosylformylglycinamidine synthase